ncbi:MAG: FAD-dependent oxidoreductase, partial [candidate division WOR-3 bacterium]
MGYRAALISLFIVGGGQIYSGRIWTGIWLAIIFYGTIAIMAIIWTGINQAFWSLILAWLMVWLYNILDAYKGPDYDRPPCERNCPAGMPSWIYLNFLATKSEQLFPFWPFYRTLGFICPAPCEDHCTRRAIDQSLAIRYLKLFIKVNREKPKKLNPKFKIAVVGAGPSGLSCAYRLATRGYRVTIYERENRPGGILAHFLPQ